MFVFEKEFSIPAAPGHKSLLSHLEHALEFRLSDHSIPLRFAITQSDQSHYQCEIGMLEGLSGPESSVPDSIFRFVRRSIENTGNFNAALLVPTGIGAEIGGHAGDATPVARLLAEACDTLITHPNVVNASDVNEMPENALYVEGSVLSRLLMGTVGLQRVRANRVLVIIDAQADKIFVNSAVNAVSAARASYGFLCSRVVRVSRGSADGFPWRSARCTFGTTWACRPRTVRPCHTPRGHLPFASSSPAASSSTRWMILRQCM